MADTLLYDAQFHHFAQDYPLAPLEDNCKLLGSLLDDCLRIEVGDELFEKVEKLRSLAHCASELAQHHDEEAAQHLARKMADELMAMPVEEAMPIVRACGHYLNLTSIAETHHSMRTTKVQGRTSKSFDEVFGNLIAQGMSTDQLHNAVCKQHVEIVLTAHPTQVNRRTLQYKHMRIAALLAQNDRSDLSAEERETTIEELVREITALWQTDELRRKKPSALDEARGGLHIVEQSLWTAVPAYLRRVNAALLKHTGKELPISAVPLSFGSWMGGDRDGNPNVTAKVTHSVACLARWMAADLYLREVDVLRFELSMTHASDEVWQLAADISARDHSEPMTAEPIVRPNRGDLGTPGVSLKSMTVKTKGGSARGGVGPGGDSPVAPEALSLLSEFQQTVHRPKSQYTGAAARKKQQAPGGDPRSPTSEPAWSPGASDGGTTSSQEAPKGANGVEGASNSSSPLAGREGGDLSRRRTGSEGIDLAGMARKNLQSVSFRDAALPKVDSQGRLLSSKDLKRRGMKAASFHKTSIDALLHHKHAGATPYRAVLGDVRQKLLNTRKRMEDVLAGVPPNDEEEWYDSAEALAQPLLICYWSLWECGSGIVAEGRLLDLLRRLYCFGVSLMKMDLRQESTRHNEAVDAITRYLDLGSYAEWSEEKRLEWLSQELEGRRPLIPVAMPMPQEVREVIDTFKVAAELGSESLGAYVISMAHTASDVLAVELLKREACHLVNHGWDAQRVAPLFETLADLDNAGTVMRRLFSVPWYRERLRQVHGDHQEVMLGYSDSGKDAGRVAAAWALYGCQEQLVEVCQEFGITLTLFHGRGGTVGRGGGPMYLAIQSQPPGSVQGSLRITEQGEMIQAKFGSSSVAERQLEIYSTAVLLATERPPKAPRSKQWPKLMDEFSKLSCADYRGIVFQHPDFISYFRQVTPEEELVHLNIGSRPSRRKKGGGVETLRAIPWIFAWTQTRMVLPSWLGVGEGLKQLYAQGHLAELQEMYAEWPFFQSTFDLIEMILAKADMRICSIYDEQLLESGAKERELGLELRQKFHDTVEAVLQLSGHQHLCQNNTTLRRLILMRNPFIDQANVMQVEILKRLRRDPDNETLRDALLISINALASGMRNTG